MPYMCDIFDLVRKWSIVIFFQAFYSLFAHLVIQGLCILESTERLEASVSKWIRCAVLLTKMCNTCMTLITWLCAVWPSYYLFNFIFISLPMFLPAQIIIYSYSKHGLFSMHYNLTNLFVCFFFSYDTHEQKKHVKLCGRKGDLKKMNSGEMLQKTE